MRRSKRLIYFLLMIAMLLSLLACANENGNQNESNSPGALRLVEQDDTLVLENEKIRLVLNKSTGGIQELLNKEEKLYLTRDSADALPVRLVTATQTISDWSGFRYQILTNSDEEKKLLLHWDFPQGRAVESLVTLEAGSDTLRFHPSLKGNQQEDTVVAVEYPIIEKITSLGEPEKDRFLSPFVTGYLFHDPVTNFNRDFYGITREMGEYPSGWGYPMQFSAYYSENGGGFYWQTDDGGNTVKSFTMTGDDGNLRLSVYHYLDDIATGDTEFSYDVCFANLTQGTWYEAANRYRQWASQQSWATQTGKLSQRTDVDKTLYEDTTLALFGLRVAEDWADYTDIYDVLKSTIDGNFLNVAIYRNDRYLDKQKEYGDSLHCFEFSSLRLTDTAEDYCDYYSTAMSNARGEKETFTIHYYECAAEPAWREYALSRERGFIVNYDVDGFYYDVDIAADHPKLCYDTTHTHGTRVNVIDDFIDQIQEARFLASDGKIYSVGTEMIFEQLLPYVNYYQARSAGGVMSWMENDRIRALMENGSAQLVPLFDYVYHEYGIVRIDGYLTAEESLGEGFYHSAAYTALNGGICELNYEYYPMEDLPATESMDLERLDFLNALGKLRTGEGKNFLVYGKMLPAPETGCQTTVYPFKNLNYTPYSCVGKEALEGEVEVKNVVTSAFEYEGEVALFLCNVTQQTEELNFTVYAGRDYGVEEGVLCLGTEEIAQVKDGTAKVKITLAPHEIAMLTLRSTQQ